MPEKLLAAVVLVMCLAALLRMLLRPAQRARVDRTLQRSWWWCRDALQRMLRRRRVRSADAQREAREAIERAARKKKMH
jgi:Tfp pilus assembly protein PilV